MPRIESLPLPPGLRSSPWTGVGDVYEVQEHLLLHYLGVKTGQDARVLPYKSAGSGGVWTCGFWAQPNWPWSHRHITWPAGRFFLYMLSHPGSPWDLALGSKTCHLILSSCRSVRPEVGEAMAQVGGSRWDVSTVLGASAALCGHLGGGERVGFGIRQSWVSSLAMPHLAKSLHFSAPVSSSAKWGQGNTSL